MLLSVVSEQLQLHDDVLMLLLSDDLDQGGVGFQVAVVIGLILGVAQAWFEEQTTHVKLSVNPSLGAP